MDVQSLERQFRRIGARVKVNGLSQLRQRAMTMLGLTTIDIGRDRDGEFFDLHIGSPAAPLVQVLQVQPDVRHLLLLTRDSNVGDKHKFLCGHDERHWFVAAIPETARVSSVRSAMEALKPAAVQMRQDRFRVRPKNRNRRRNEAFIRQGEWFFIPAPLSFVADPKAIFRHEPLRRGGGKPHVCDELVRRGGETVYVSSRYPNGLTENEYRSLLRDQPDQRHRHWVVQRRNPQVFVRGRIRHSDHKTIVLSGWHEVLMNTETQAAAMRHVAFID